MKQVTDERGTVREFYRESAFEDAGLPSLGPWLQVNVTETKQGGLRGMHAEDMTKLVAVVAGEAFGAYVDPRRQSPTHGKVVTVTLTPGTQVLVPRGVGNGFQATAPGVTQYLYCFDQEWVPGMAGLACNPLDPALGIDWPLPDRPGRSRPGVGEGPQRPPVRRSRRSRPMKLLVTGGAGFIGSNYVRYVLGETDDEVVVYDALTYAGNLSTLKRRRRRPALLLREGQHLRPGDARGRHDRRRRRRALRRREPRRPLDRRLRRLRQHQLLRHQRRDGHRPPARASSGSSTSAPTRCTARWRSGSSNEDDPLEPRSPYSASKAGSDLIALSYHHTHGLPVTVTRCTNNFGPYQYPEKAIPLFTTNLLDGGKVPLYGDGLNERDWLYVDDHCSGVHLVLRRRACRARSTTSAPATRRRTGCWSTSSSRLLGKDESSVDYVEDRLGHDRRYSVDIAKITELGWTKQRTLDEALARPPSTGTAPTSGGGGR